METWTKHMRAIADRTAELGSADEAVRCYALMDMRAYPTLSTELWKDAGTACWRLWQGTDLEAHADIGPQTGTATRRQTRPSNRNRPRRR